MIHDKEERTLPAALPSRQLTFRGYQQLLIFPLMDKLHVVSVPLFFPLFFFPQTVLSIDFHLFYTILNCHH